MSVILDTVNAGTIQTLFHTRKWIRIKPAIWITFIPAKMHKNQPAITKIYIKRRFNCQMSEDNPLFNSVPLSSSKGAEINKFFSLVDYLNNYFVNDDTNKIIEFYNSFENTGQLIRWMRERPRGGVNIREVDGRKDIIVVIPTMDVNNKYAVEAREKIFKGLQIIFVESGRDFYFNYAHNCNIGVKKALAYSPDWIVISNDDMYKIDNIEVLINKLLKLDNKTVEVVFTQPSKYHSIPVYFSKGNIFRRIYFKMSKYRREQLRIENRYSVRYFSSPRYGYGRYFFNHKNPHISIADFGIFSSKFIERIGGKLFDETYVHGGEDVDLSLEVARSGRYTFINFSIGDFLGSSLGRNINRKLRDISGYIYLNYKLNNGDFKFDCLKTLRNAPKGGKRDENLYFC
jgi:GT2 family glycosyltransferase